ncbi:HAD family phosphatase [Staphylococcus chromogenes]|uniref:Cof-type HAD-IIB family hydrolase n=1 Tax=Staphylococcus chromogenes TaxID=46126 RepID=UPI00118B6180|nr:Cof-type HAD-IIB family hydrolase [Staphylococcus chromogenes]QDW91736.1 HAD family phosphatase [Staphylococcus chromogenes]
MKPDLIIMDMDDTLMTSENIVSETTKNYLIEIQEAGYSIALASGRPTEGMIPVAHTLKMDQFESYIMSYNGANTIDLKTKEVIASKMISKESFDKIVDFCREKGLFTLTYHEGHIVYEGQHEYMSIESEITGLPMKEVKDLKDYIQGPVPKAMGVDYEEHISEIFNTLDGHFNDEIACTTSKPFFLEFMSSGVSKGKAIQDLANRLNLDVQKMIAFGDSANDKEMFEVVGTSVAMDNAIELLKSRATLTTKSHDEDGIPFALKQLI